MNSILDTTTTIAAVTAGAAGGVYLAFSAMVMPVLRTLPAAESVVAMQRINVAAVRLPFMVVFFGSAATAAAVLVADLMGDGSADAGLGRIIGAGLAIAAFGITVVSNVPLNNSLGRLNAGDRDVAGAWRRFDRRWSRSNLLRGASALIGATVLAASLARSSG
ncbi:DUF1772 domain-containing protein [Leifsonia sp. YAF41]|uniref:anthrone oxygenase family protein n=1 Tax=Leifsonia sp. YAF41 TaxID=3233086 RepID=UPI003F9ABA79